MKIDKEEVMNAIEREVVETFTEETTGVSLKKVGEIRVKIE